MKESDGERGKERKGQGRVRARRRGREIFLPVSIGYDYIRSIKYSYYIPQEVIVCVFPI